jgi:hypothetical protein
MLLAAVLQLVALTIVGAAIPFTISGVAGRPASLVAVDPVDRGERVLRIVVAVDRVIIDLMFTLVIEGIGAIEKVGQLLDAASASLRTRPKCSNNSSAEMSVGI